MMDQLVKEGIELDQAYSFEFCSPTRSSLQSGRLPVHVNMVNLAPDMRNPRDPISGFAGIPRAMTGIAHKMKQGGYVTHQVGKWDAGMATVDHTPHGRGYDTSFGYFHHAVSTPPSLTALSHKICSDRLFVISRDAFDARMTIGTNTSALSLTSTTRLSTRLGLALVLRSDRLTVLPMDSTARALPETIHLLAGVV